MKTAEEIYNESPTTWLAAHEDLGSLLADEDYWVENGFWDTRDESLEPVTCFLSAFFIISNPDHECYNEQFSRLECDFEAVTIHSDTCHAGHLEPEGEAGRVVLLPVEIDTEKLKSIIPDIVFDIHQLK
jgi:hypothetical protein